jgi:hypothetical protein
MKRDVPVIGFIIGLLLPVVGVFIMYLLWGHNSGFGSFLHSLTRLKGMASKVLTLGLLINLIPFVYCVFKRYDYTLRGIFTATMLYVVFIILVMYVW